MQQMDLVPIWKALADSKRHRIIQLLQEKARTTSEISTYFNVSRFAIMRHLKVLEQAGLIKTRREGRQRWNFLNEDLFHQIQRTYLEDDLNGGYRFADILSFLAQSEGTWANGHSISPVQQPIEIEVELQATPDRVFKVLTDEIDSWWSYRIAADSHMHLETFVGGRFYEAFVSGGGTLYAWVTFFKPGQEIRLNGSMGLADGEANSIVHIALRQRQPGTTCLALSHRFLGRASAITVDTFKRSWIELLAQHLKAFVELGSPLQAPL